jgi:hypothetical protein
MRGRGGDNADQKGSWRADFHKLYPPLSVAFGWRFSYSDRSLHSLHRWVDLHLIRSLLAA